MVADTTRLDDSHAPCAETTLRVRPGRSAGLSSDLVAFLCPAPMAGLFFAGVLSEKYAKQIPSSPSCRVRPVPGATRDHIGACVTPLSHSPTPPVAGCPAWERFAYFSDRTLGWLWRCDTRCCQTLND